MKDELSVPYEDEDEDEEESRMYVGGDTTCYAEALMTGAGGDKLMWRNA